MRSLLGRSKHFDFRALAKRGMTRLTGSLCHMSLPPLPLCAFAKTGGSLVVRTTARDDGHLMHALVVVGRRTRGERRSLGKRGRIERLGRHQLDVGSGDPTRRVTQPLLDPGRTSVYHAAPNAEQKRLIEGTVEVNEAIIAALQPGATPREVGVIADATATRLGLPIPETGSHLYGHGMSTFWSGPVIPGASASHVEDDSYWNIDEPFYAGQLFTAEAFFEEPGVGLSGIEDVVIIWEDRVERVTTTPTIFW